jgi:outer membrane receptor protein involved in Fe transport
LLTADHYWDSRDDTDWKTKAVFGEVVWHITDQWDLTVGGRWVETKNDKVYIKFLAGHTGSDDRQTGGFIQPIWMGHEVTQSEKISEFVPKLSIAYQIDDTKMVYALYSEGYRTGGINRANRKADWSRTLWPQAWDPDKLKNYELGLKSRWADNTVQFNLTYFYMDWQDFQHEIVDPSVGECIVPEEEPQCEPTGSLPWISIVGNVGDAHSTGFQAELDWVPADRWVLGGNAMWLEAEIDSTTSGPEAGIETGQQLPNTPKLQGALWATYTWPVEFIPGSEMFLRGQYSYTGKTHTLLVPAGLDSPAPSFTNDSYSLVDLRLGLVTGQWEIDLFINNLTDKRAQVWQGSALGAWQWGRSGEYEHAHNVFTVRPREYGLRFTTRWE